MTWTRNGLLALALAILLSGCGTLSQSAPKPTAATSHETSDIQASVQYLASDDLEGRGVGTAGIDKAADFIAARFARIGLKPAPKSKDYFQTFDWTASVELDPKTNLSVNDRKLALNIDFRPSAYSATGSFAGDVVFAGYGIASEKYSHDDYGDADLKGKVALVLRFEPHDEKGKSRFEDNAWSEVATLHKKASVAAERGAVALLVVNPPKFHDDMLPPWNMFGSAQSPRAKIPIIHIKQAVAEEMLAKGGAGKLETLQERLDDGKEPVKPIELKGVNVSGEVAVRRREVQVRNVVGVLPGSGRHADEYVVVGAHYDHLGRGGPGSMAPSSKEIHNGADDNASGTAALVELAARLAKSGSLDRSVLFVAFTAEESGLIGSQHFVDHPPVPLDKIVAMLNMDMVGRVRGQTLYIGGTGTAAEFGPLMKQLDDQSPLELKTFGKGGIAPSDHTSFALKNIPVLFFFSGLHVDYHRPTDDSDKINYDGISEVVDLGAATVRALATMPRSQYVETFDVPFMHSATGPSPGGGGGGGAMLGVMPDYASEEAVGVRISGALPNTPAAAAGLKDGDVITRFGDEEIATLMDLSQSLARAKPGDKVKLIVKRDGREIELHAVLGERR